MRVDIKQVNDEFSVSVQITPGDVQSLAAFGYGGKLLPSFPQWVINGQKPSRLAWVLKEKILPPIYWKAMLKGKEWMVNPEQAKPRTATG